MGKLLDKQDKEVKESESRAKYAKIVSFAIEHDWLSLASQAETEDCYPHCYFLTEMGNIIHILFDDDGVCVEVVDSYDSKGE